MFDTFNHYTSKDIGLMKLLSVEDSDKFNGYKDRLFYAEDFKSIIVFPEQLIGFKGRIFSIHLRSTLQVRKNILVADSIDIRGISCDGKEITNDDEVDLSKEFNLICPGQPRAPLILPDRYLFIKMKHASRFAEKIAGSLFEGF